MRKIAILICGCTSRHYPKLTDMVRRTWGRKRGFEVDFFYVYGRPSGDAGKSVMRKWLGGEVPDVADNEIFSKRDILIAGCTDSYQEETDCVLQKRLIAYDYLARERNYDLIYSVDDGSYVDHDVLMENIRKLPSRNFIYGALSIDRSGSIPFVSGASNILSADIALELGKRRIQIRNDYRFEYADDVAIGSFITDNFCSAPNEEIVNAIVNGLPQPTGSVFISSSRTTVDYVLSGKMPLMRRRGVFHYHFNSAEPRKIEAFHYRYFLN